MTVNRFLQVTAFTRLSVKSTPFSSSPATWCIRTTNLAPNFESLLFHRLWTLEVIVKTVINSWKSCFWTSFLNLYLEVASLPLHLNLFRLSTFPKFDVWYSLVLNLYAFVAWNKLGIFFYPTLYMLGIPIVLFSINFQLGSLEGSNLCWTVMSSVAKSKRLQSETRQRSGNPDADSKMSSNTVPTNLDLKDAIDSAR